MQKLQFTVDINAPKEKVWEKLWSDSGYRAWTSAFCEGSYAESDWKEGSKIVFLSPDGSGMFGIIKKKVDNEEMIFKHHGEVKNGVEERKDWGGAEEAYHLTETNGKTQVKVEVDITEEHKGYFDDIFPKALAILKRISEEQ
jgi:uncharacterized protein YndB with AHSA1/START domain